MMASNPEQPAASVEDDLSAFPNFRLQRALIDLTDPNDQDMLEQSALDAFVAIEDIARIVAREEIAAAREADAQRCAGDCDEGHGSCAECAEAAAAEPMPKRGKHICEAIPDDTLDDDESLENAAYCTRGEGHEGRHSWEPEPAASEPRMMAWNPSKRGWPHGAWAGGPHLETPECKAGPPHVQCQPALVMSAPKATHDVRYNEKTGNMEIRSAFEAAAEPKPQPRMMVCLTGKTGSLHMDGAIHDENDECKQSRCSVLPNAISEPQTVERINTVRGYVMRSRPPWANARDLALLLAALDALAELSQVREDLAATNTECDALRAKLEGKC